MYFQLLFLNSLAVILASVLETFLKLLIKILKCTKRSCCSSVDGHPLLYWACCLPQALLEIFYSIFLDATLEGFSLIITFVFLLRISFTFSSYCQSTTLLFLCKYSHSLFRFQNYELIITRSLFPAHRSPPRCRIVCPVIC